MIKFRQNNIERCKNGIMEWWNGGMVEYNPKSLKTEYKVLVYIYNPKSLKTEYKVLVYKKICKKSKCRCNSLNM